MSTGGNGGLFLPRADEAQIPAEKLRDYALNPAHPTGLHKARVFRSTLAIEQRDWQYLRDQILERVPESVVISIRPKPPYGAEYEVRVMIDGLNGVSHPVITAWLVPPDGYPRLVSAYVELPRRA